MVNEHENIHPDQLNNNGEDEEEKQVVFTTSLIRELEAHKVSQSQTQKKLNTSKRYSKNDTRLTSIGNFVRV